jgi:pilus assembly protein CpaF
MVAMMGGEMPISVVRQQVASGINVVLQLARLPDGSRRVISVSEITGMEGDVISMQDIYRFRQTGRASDGTILGGFAATGIRPKFAERLEASGFSLAGEIFAEGV